MKTQDVSVSGVEAGDGPAPHQVHLMGHGDARHRRPTDVVVGDEESRGNPAEHSDLVTDVHQIWSGGRFDFADQLEAGRTHGVQQYEMAACSQLTLTIRNCRVRSGQYDRHDGNIRERRLSAGRSRPIGRSGNRHLTASQIGKRLRRAVRWRRFAPGSGILPDPIATQHFTQQSGPGASRGVSPRKPRPARRPFRPAHSRRGGIEWDGMGQRGAAYGSEGWGFESLRAREV